MIQRLSELTKLDKSCFEFYDKKRLKEEYYLLIDEEIPLEITGRRCNNWKGKRGEENE